MPAVELFRRMVGVKSHDFSKKENIFLEAELFMHVCDELKKFFKAKNINYFYRINLEKEGGEMEENLACCIINDILSSEEYTLSGIACYTYTPEDVIYEIAIGNNKTPSAVILCKLIELHRLVRREFYQEIAKKLSFAS